MKVKGNYKIFAIEKLNSREPKTQTKKIGLDSRPLSLAFFQNSLKLTLQESKSTAFGVPSRILRQECCYSLRFEADVDS
jgi:hypothetical protein